MSAIAAWVFFVFAAAVILFIAGAKTAEVRRVNDELLDALARLTNACEELPEEQSDLFNDEVEYARGVVEAYDEYQLTRDTLPR